MKLTLKHQSTEKQSAPGCTVVEYPLKSENLNMAIAKLEGRYPDKKRVVNQRCAELAYVFAGQGKIVINGKEQTLQAGDAILIEAGEKFYWEGSMQLFLSCSPAWHPEQHELVD